MNSQGRELEEWRRVTTNLQQTTSLLLCRGGRDARSHTNMTNITSNWAFKSQGSDFRTWGQRYISSWTRGKDLIIPFDEDFVKQECTATKDIPTSEILNASCTYIFSSNAGDKRRRRRVLWTTYRRCTSRHSVRNVQRRKTKYTMYNHGRTITKISAPPLWMSSLNSELKDFQVFAFILLTRHLEERKRFDNYNYNYHQDRESVTCPGA